MPPSTTLEARLAYLLADRNAAERQFSWANNEVERQRLRRQIDDFDEEIEKVNRQIESSRENTPYHRHDLLARLSEMDNRRARGLAGKTKERLVHRTGAASFFIQNSAEMEGGLFVEWLKQAFKVNPAKFSHRLIGFPASTQLNELKLIQEFKRQLNINKSFETQEKEIDAIIEELCGSLSNGKVLFIELEFWETLNQREEFLTWILKAFWSRLLDKQKEIECKFDMVHFVLVIVANNKLFPRRMPDQLFCSIKKPDQQKLLELRLQRWQVRDIEIWLKSHANLNLDRNQIEQMARIIHGGNGTPSRVRAALEKELDGHFGCP